MTRIENKEYTATVEVKLLIQADSIESARCAAKEWESGEVTSVGIYGLYSRDIDKFYISY